MTYAIKARKLLSSSGIFAKLIKVDSNENTSGCTHGIEINYNDFFAAIGKIKDSNIPYNILKNK